MTKKFKDLIRRKDNLWYVKYARIPFTGVTEDFYGNGQLRFKENWKDGKAHGLWEEYYKEGQLKLKQNYKKSIYTN